MTVCFWMKTSLLSGECILVEVLEPSHCAFALQSQHHLPRVPLKE